MNQAKIKYIVDVLLGITFLITTVTGIIIFFFLPSGVPRGGYQVFLGIIKSTWSLWHNYAGIIMIILVGVHLFLNINWIVCMTKAMFKKDKGVCEPTPKKKKQ